MSQTSEAQRQAAKTKMRDVAQRVFADKTEEYMARMGRGGERAKTRSAWLAAWKRGITMRNGLTPVRYLSLLFTLRRPYPPSATPTAPSSSFLLPAPRLLMIICLPSFVR